MNNDILDIDFPCTVALVDIKIKSKFPIKIETGSVIHPKVLIDSTCGPVFIGKKCIIEENCTIKAPNQQGIRINDTCIIEFRSFVEACSIGSGTRIGAGCFIDTGCYLSEDCKIMPKTRLQKETFLPERTVIYANGEKRILDNCLKESKRTLIEKHVEYLTKHLGKYNKLYTPKI
ncbi:hypothetical protein PORY_001647 [Pneumocystis oryctolagi]|uniref:Uncharacterized protein n=1 Tax=Pneumocystis oryctolagi TaxID=42067 RepID=A0ACB7CD24_9ASCO|nr:hypothetical protein PORY_001647 [Pneumocystis oryctolagi]